MIQAASFLKVCLQRQQGSLVLLGHVMWVNMIWNRDCITEEIDFYRLQAIAVKWNSGHKA